MTERERLRYLVILFLISQGKSIRRQRRFPLIGIRPSRPEGLSQSGNILFHAFEWALAEESSEAASQCNYELHFCYNPLRRFHYGASPQPRRKFQIPRIRH